MLHVLERRGSSKDIWKVLGDNGEVIQFYFVFSDRVSVFDVGPLPLMFPGLGQLRCAIAGRIFQALNSAGISTHYISHDVDEARMYVQPVNILALDTDYGEYSTYNLWPVELLCRRMITKKFFSRIKDGKRLRLGEIARSRIERLLVSSELREMAVMHPPFVECSTKFEAADRYLTDAEAARLIGISENLLTRSHYGWVQEIFEFLYTYLRSEGNFLLIDGKIEVALSPDGHPMLVDSLSPDELGLIDPQGRLADKNLIRSYVIEYYPEWYEELEITKQLYPTDKSKWPGYPRDLFLPKELIDQYIEKTRQVAVAIGAI